MSGMSSWSPDETTITTDATRGTAAIGTAMIVTAKWIEAEIGRGRGGMTTVMGRTNVTVVGTLLQPKVSHSGDDSRTRLICM